MHALALTLSIVLASTPPAGKGGAEEPWAQEAQEAQEAELPPHPHDELQPDEIRETQLWVAVITTAGIVLGPIGAAVVGYWLTGARRQRKKACLAMRDAIDPLKDAGRDRGGPGGS